MKNKELKPCPFCGGEARMYSTGNGMVNYVRCLECNAGTSAYNRIHKPIAVWNTRTNTITAGNGENYEVIQK